MALIEKGESVSLPRKKSLSRAQRVARKRKIKELLEVFEGKKTSYKQLEERKDATEKDEQV